MESSLTTSRYFEDLTEGDVFVSDEKEVSSDDILRFAALSGDFNPIHTDTERARASGYEHVVAHGLLGMALLSGLVHDLRVFNDTTIALLGVDNWRFHHPIFAGDTVRVRLTVTGLRLASDGARGIVSRHIEGENGTGVVVQSGDMPLMVKTRPVSAERRHS